MEMGSSEPLHPAGPRDDLLLIFLPHFVALVEKLCKGRFDPLLKLGLLVNLPRGDILRDMISPAFSNV